MSTEYQIDATIREFTGKADSRRQRRLNNAIPAVIYGGDDKPKSILVNSFTIAKISQQEGFYSNIIKINIDNAPQQVVLKAVQRHPVKSNITHMDFLRVSDKNMLSTSVPIHFINEKNAVGVKSGGIISHIATNIKVTCYAKDLPEFIEIDVANLKIEQTLHLHDIAAIKNIIFTDMQNNPSMPIISIHKVKEHKVESSTEESSAGPTEGT